jgi:hypothetical protein
VTGQLIQFPRREDWGSPMRDEDRAFLDTFVWTDALLREYADRARRFIDSLWKTDVAELERADEGTCEECGIETFVRFRYGKFALCRVCARRRRRALAEMERSA